MLIERAFLHNENNKKNHSIYYSNFWAKYDNRVSFEKTTASFFFLVRSFKKVINTWFTGGLIDQLAEVTAANDIDGTDFRFIKRELLQSRDDLATNHAVVNDRFSKTAFQSAVDRSV